MPHLQQLWSGLSEGRDDLVFLCVNLGDEAEVIRKWWEVSGFTLTAVRQEGDTVSRAFGVQAYPTNYVIGPDGAVQYRGVGWDEAAVRVALSGADEASPAAALAAAPQTTPAWSPALFPDADPDAVTYLLAFEQRCAQAQALYFTAEGTLDGPTLSGTVAMQVAVAHPSLGRLEATTTLFPNDAAEDSKPRERRTVFEGDGRSVSGPLSNAGGTWKDAGIGVGVAPFAAWAGVEPEPRTGVAFAAEEPEHPQRTGIRYRGVDGAMYTLWFDAAGDWVGVRVEYGVDDAASGMRMAIRDFRLEDEIDPETWKVPGPKKGDGD